MKIYIQQYHELWHYIYPLVYALQNGANLDYGKSRGDMFDMKCLDGGSVSVNGNVLNIKFELKESIKRNEERK